MTITSPPQYRDAVADAKAARAIARTQRPWYRKKRWWLAALSGIVVVAGIAGSASPNATTATHNTNVTTRITGRALAPRVAASHVEIDSVDVAAARACVSIANMVSAARAGDIGLTGQDVLAKAAVLLRGTAQARAHGTAAPKYATLGADLVTLAGDLTQGNDATNITAHGDAVLNECYALPADAKTQAGYHGQPAG